MEVAVTLVDLIRKLVRRGPLLDRSWAAQTWELSMYTAQRSPTEATIRFGQGFIICVPR